MAASVTAKKSLKARTIGTVNLGNYATGGVPITPRSRTAPLWAASTRVEAVGFGDASRSAGL